MRKSLIVSLLTLSLSVSSLFSQQLPKTLLWRISGNGLQKPSYLYGTMHLTDPRLFELGDSLLHVISSTEGFANELDLSQITPMVTEMIQQRISNAVYLKALVSKKAFDQYGPQLAKKFNKPAEEITTMDLLREKNKWINENYKGRKMQTFLDAYLMDLAYRQGKWIGGIEDLSDQSGLINSTIDETDIKQMVMGEGSDEKQEMENMTSIYLRGDPDGLQQFVNGVDSGFNNQALIRRNHKMAFRIDSLAFVRSTVFAIGALHLPGKQGLIQLFRARGFNVDPVFSTKKVKPEDYPVQEIQRQWVEVRDPDGRYKVMMPGVPGNVKLYGIVSMEVYYDIFNGTLYTTAGFTSPASPKSLDSTVLVMLNNVFEGTDYKVEKSLNINGISGKSYIQKKADGYKQIYVMKNNNTVYFAMGFSASGTENSLQSVKHFFDSYQPLIIHRSQTANSYVYTDSVHGYTLMLPSKPVRMEKLPAGDNTLNAELMLVTDQETGAYYFCGSSDCKKGYAFQNDSFSIQAVRKGIRGKYTDLTLDTVYTENNNRVLKINGSVVNGTMRVKSVVILRGNRYCSIIIIYTPGKWTDEMGKTLASFQLLNYPAGHWSRQSAPDSLFTTWAPDVISYVDGKDTNSDLKSRYYQCFDSIRVHNYIMHTDTLGDYFWAKNESDFWAAERARFVHESDTVLSEKIFKKDGLLQYEFSGRAKGGMNTIRMHFWLLGNKLYRVSTVQETGTIGEENVNRFFDQLHFNIPVEETHAFESKSALILKDLRSSDTLVSREANKALAVAHFEKRDIPLLQEAILVSYPADEAVTNSTNGQIAEIIIQLDDSSSVFFARSHFAEANDTDEKNALLDIMSAWHSPSNYDSLGKLLTASPAEFELPKWVTNRWNDSLKVAARLFPAVLPLLDDSVTAPAIYNLAESLLYDSLISISVFRPWQKEILKYAEQRYRKTKTDTLYYTVPDYAVISMIQRLKSDPCNAMLKKWLGVEGNLYHKQAIVLALLQNNQTVSPTVISELAADEYTRVDLYRNLKKYNHVAWFPAKWLSQSNFAAGLARESAERFSDGETEIKFIRMKDMKWKGKMARFYFYDLFLKEDNEHWLATAGPFNLNGKSVSLSEAETDVYSEEKYDAKYADDLMKALVLQMSNK